MVHYLLAKIDLLAITHNIRTLKQLIPSGCKFCVAAKCNAYGHNIETVLPAFESAGVDMLAVSTIPEARQLISLNWQKPILILGSEFSVYSSNRKKILAHWLVENDIRITAMLPEDIEFLIAAARKIHKKAIVHIMLDTGMGRMGLIENDLLKLIDLIGHNKEIQIEGLYTHFADAHNKDKSYSNQQLQKFNAFLKHLEKLNINIPLIHAANSAALIDLPDSHFNMVRPGISVYGYHAGPDMLNKPLLKPAMKVISYLTAVKNVKKASFIGYGQTWQAPEDMTIGLVPIGYGDGYDRRLSNTGQMTINNTIAPVIGRISMDQTIVDLRALIKKGLTVRPGQEITIIDNNPTAPNSVEAIADKLNTIAYEITTSLGPRIVKVPL
ncbi:MAG: alanine racemase [Planctomycetota bacterium]|jgi:alanine racemase